MSNSCETKDRVFAFINAENLEEIKSRESRTQVSRHVGKYYRNRSKPSQKKVHKDDASQASATEQSYKNSISDDIAVPSGNAVAFDATEDYDQHMAITTVSTHLDRRKHTQAAPEKSKARDMKNMQRVLKFTHFDRRTIVRRHDNISQHPKTLLKGQCGDIKEDSFKDEEMCFRDKWSCDPIHLLSKNRADPFATYPVDDARDQISLIVDHGTSRITVRYL